MTDWMEAARKYLTSLDGEAPESGWTIGEPANAEQIAALENKIGYLLPTEFHECYKSMNGFGISEGCYYGLLAIEDIPDTITEVHLWLDETPINDYRFIPIESWGDGDYTGYLYFTEGKLYNGMYWFSHEQLEDVETWEDVFQMGEWEPFSSSLLDLLTEGWEEKN
jgi:cell wall assembly regulator SMI1